MVFLRSWRTTCQQFLKKSPEYFSAVGNIRIIAPLYVLNCLGGASAGASFFAHLKYVYKKNLKKIKNIFAD